jgi:RNA polymerase sigma-B factor
MKAVEKFDPLAGTSFKTYSTYLITGEIRHYLRDKTSMIKAPRQIYELYYRVNQIVQKLSDELCRTPTDGEIAEFLQCPVDKVTAAQEIERRRQPVSLDQFSTNSQGNETVYIERLMDDSYFGMVQHRENRMTLESALENLNEDLRVVVRMTYFDDLSQTEIAKHLGISQMQVSRRLRKALDLLSKDIQRDAVDLTH